ncbi:MAG: SDR family NAD(P)-dependent oxidoreductase [Jatrophihabitans sp.]|nr:MAG: SDR family NAD(P)-dependent oxidoreductase [Jatrophihabitans sp.]
MRSLQGTVVAITGGARGIGAATARTLAAQGARVAIGDLDLDLARQTAQAIGSGTVALPLDVTDRESFRGFLDDTERLLGAVDVLINNAGIMPLGRLDEMGEPTVDRILEINLAAVLFGTREAMRRMRARGRGHIVNVASFAGKAGIAGGAAYCASKHGVVGLSEAVLGELRGSGVDISVVMPTIVRTELAAGLRETRLSSQVAPEDVAAAIVATLRRPRFEVYVPRYLGVTMKITRVLPHRVGLWIGRASHTDAVFTDALAAPERVAYEKRASAS